MGQGPLCEREDRACNGLQQNAMHEDVMRLLVETTRTSRGDEEPRAFLLGNRRIVVVEIVDRWISTAQSYFKVVGDDEALYILRQEAASGEWEMTLFQAPTQRME